MTNLSVENLEVAIGGRQILHGLSFATHGGELIGLIGPNGSGKTTLLRALLGLIPSQGEMRLDGVDLRGLSPAARALKLSYVAQDREVAWPLSVETVVALGRSPYRSALRRPTENETELIERAMRAADVLDLRTRAISDLSGGERARVLIARALAQNTDVLLADEPTAALDPAHQINLVNIFTALAAAGRVVFMTCHDLSLAARWCTRLLLIDRGTIVADGPPREVLSPRNLRTVYGVDAFFAEDDGKLVVVPKTAPARGV